MSRFESDKARRMRAPNGLARSATDKSGRHGNGAVTVEGGRYSRGRVREQIRVAGNGQARTIAGGVGGKRADSGGGKRAGAGNSARSWREASGGERERICAGRGGQLRAEDGLGFAEAGLRGGVAVQLYDVTWCRLQRNPAVAGLFLSVRFS